MLLTISQLYIANQNNADFLPEIIERLKENSTNPTSLELLLELAREVEFLKIRVEEMDFDEAFQMLELRKINTQIGDNFLSIQIRNDNEIYKCFRN